MAMNENMKGTRKISAGHHDAINFNTSFMSDFSDGRVAFGTRCGSASAVKKHVLDHVVDGSAVASV
jgi:hypothetical protein